MIAKFRGNGTPHYTLNATHRVPNQIKPNRSFPDVPETLIYRTRLS